MIKPYKNIMPTIGKDVFIEESAQVVGEVEIGDKSSVWFNAVVRGDVNYIKIGSRTNIQDNSVLHVSRGTFPLNIGDDVTVGHNVTLHGCTVEDACLIGMGSIILDGAVIGKESLIGAGALVKEGFKVPPRSLAVGFPARVVRELTDEEVERLYGSAEHYIDDSKDYMDGDK